MFNLKNEKKLMKKVIYLTLSVVLLACSNTDKNADKAITGANAYDIKMALEERGFAVQKQCAKGFGCMFTMTNDYGGLKAEVKTSSPYDDKLDKIEQLRISLTTDGAKNIVAGKQIMKFISTFQYDAAKPNEAAAWVDANYDKDGATTTIGDATFAINGKTQFIRMLTVTKYKPVTEPK